MDSTGLRRHLVFIGGTSRKFWEITVEGSRHVVRFGRIGSEGQRRTKAFLDAEAAHRDAARLIREKLRKGYRDFPDVTDA